MFTGIIEQIGEVKSNQGGKLLVSVTPNFVSGLEVGSSVAVNGVCLTLIDKKKENQQRAVIIFEMMAETLGRTNLGGLKKGVEVNLERALRLGDRLEGHIVQGHIDVKVKVKSLKSSLPSALAKAGQMSKMSTAGIANRIMRIGLPKKYRRYVVPKGSIAVDGVSLTVVEVKTNWFSVAIIPQTWERTIIKNYQSGEVVNIEVDVVGKYLEKMNMKYA